MPKSKYLKDLTANRRNLAEVANQLVVVVVDPVVMRLLYLMHQTSIKKFMDQRIFGWLNFMLHGADIVKLLNQNGKLLLKNLRDKLN